MTGSKDHRYLDPDEIYISKATISDIIDAIIDRWKKNGANLLDKNVSALKLFKMGLKFQSDQTVNEIMKAIIKVVNEIQLLNQMQRMAGENPKTRELAKLAIEKIKSDDFGTR